MSDGTGGLIELAVAIELECAALYEVFARRFQGNDEFVYFWRLYAEAERYHAASIRIHQATFAGDEPVAEPIDIAGARGLLDELRLTRGRVERDPITAAEALRLARHVEEHSAELHGRTQFFAGNTEFAEMFERMAEEDRAHRDMLGSAERKFGGVSAA